MSISEKSAQMIDLVRPLRVNATPQGLKYLKMLPHPSLPAPTASLLQHESELIRTEIVRDGVMHPRAIDKNTIALQSPQTSCHAPAVSYMSLYQPAAR